MEILENPCSINGFHDNEYHCSKCGLTTIDGEDIRYHPRHLPLSFIRKEIKCFQIKKIVDMSDTTIICIKHL